MCDRVGHTSDNCRSHLKCDFCGFTGHTINICRKRKAIQDKKNAGYGSSSKAHHADSPTSSPSTMTPSYNLTPDQYHELLALLNQAKTGSMASQVINPSGKATCASVFTSEPRWIFDTGATDHMVCSHKLMSSSIPVIDRHVQLPDNSLARVTHIGTIHFSNDFILHNVLCVPSFKLNLTSVAKLTQTSFCHAIFTNNVCLVQDKRLGKTIGMGTEKAGLYYLNISDKAGCSSASNIVSTNPYLWHQRLGHLSNKSLRALSLSTNNISFYSIDDCTVCPLAKQLVIHFL